jgi:hypothetical protein
MSRIDPHDNSVREIIKDKVAAQCYSTNAEVRTAITDTFTSLTPQMLRNILQRTWRRNKLRADYDGSRHTNP